MVGSEVRMPDVDSVAEARKKVGAAYKGLLKGMFGRQLSEMGSKKIRTDLPEISAETGSWKDVGIRNKPLAWLVMFTYDDAERRWSAMPSTSNYPNRIGGSFNARSPLQGILSRIIPVLRLTPNDSKSAEESFHVHPYWEWAIAFVFPDLPVFSRMGSSGATIDFNPGDGMLSSTIDETIHNQPYVSASLFELAPPEDEWTNGSLRLTYTQATEALKKFINVQPVVPTERHGDPDDSEV
jgi:hypothetical protein